MFLAPSKREGVGMTTISDLWIGLFPVSMTLVYIYLKAKCDAELASVNIEKQNLIKQDQLAYNRGGIEMQKQPNYLKEGGEKEKK